MITFHQLFVQSFFRINLFFIAGPNASSHVYDVVPIEENWEHQNSSNIEGITENGKLLPILLS